MTTQEAELEALPQDDVVRQVYPTSEYGLVSVPYDHMVVDGRLKLYEDVQGKGYLSVFVQRDRIVFQAGGIVGLIPINERVAIEVRPRVPVAMERLLALSGSGPIALKRELVSYATDSEANASLLDIFADSFIDAVDEVVAQGLHREYRANRADTSFPRGRIDIGETMRRHHARGVEHRVHASWFEPTVDTGPNRCIRFTLRHLARQYRGMQATTERRARLRNLNRLHSAFERAELDTRLRFLEHPFVFETARLPAIRSYYARALDIAKVILANRGISFDGHQREVTLPSLLVNMEDVFEKYVRAVLRERLPTLAPVSVQDGNVNPPNGMARSLFDPLKAGDSLAKPVPLATPDVLVCGKHLQSEQVRLVVEVKYKPIRAAPARDDLNQTITYGFVYSAPRSVVVHPAVPGGRRGLVPLGRVGAHAVYQYAIDLGAPALPDEEARFATSMIALLSDGA